MQSIVPKINLGEYLLRDIERSDYLDYYAIGVDPLTVKYVTWGPFENLNQSLWVIENIFLKRKAINLPVGYAIVDKKTDRMIGVIDFHTYYENINAAEIGFILHRDYWNKGIITMALRAMIKVGFTVLELDKIIIGHVYENKASEQVILKNSFKYEYTKYGYFKDKNGLMHDVLMYSIYKFEYERGN